MTDDLRTLHLAGRHEQAGARFAPFAGWNMPLQYGGVLAEHAAVRTSAGVFDVSHMGRVVLRGADAGDRLRSITTFDVRTMLPGQAHYSLYCNEDGGIADDIFVYRLAPERWLIVHNAANAEADRERVAATGVDLADLTGDSVMLAVQGPEARAHVARLFGDPVLGVEVRHATEVSWRGATVLLGRTGYTGEDGFECILPPEPGAALWDELLAAGVTPVGLGARDTLRLEAALPLHGHDITDATHPFEAGLGWAVTLDDGTEFTGREALARLKGQPRTRRLACLRTTEAGVPRDGYDVIVPSEGDRRVGTLTSGTFSPTLRTGIAMGYLPSPLARPGTQLAVRIRDRSVATEVVSRPFYRRSDEGAGT